MTQSACTGRNTNKLYAIKAEWRAHPVCICKARCSCNQCIVKSLWLALASLLIHQAHVKRWPHQKRKEADHFSSMSMALLSCRTITVFDSHNSLTHIKYPEPIVREINGTIVVRRSEFARSVIRQSASPPHKMRTAASVYGQTDGLRKWHRIKIPNRRGEKVMQIKMWNTYRNQVHDQTTTILVLCAEGASVRVFDAVDQHRDRKKKNIYSFIVHILLCFMLGYFCFFFFWFIHHGWLFISESSWANRKFSARTSDDFGGDTLATEEVISDFYWPHSRCVCNWILCRCRCRCVGYCSARKRLQVPECGLLFV